MHKNSINFTLNLVKMSIIQFKNQTNYYKGKVRDVYSIGENLLVMVASNRLSAFDVVLPMPIPYKGQVLTEIAAYMLNACSDICPNWLYETPAPNVSIGKNCKPFAIEMVVRGNLTGHAWRTYNAGLRNLCGVALKAGMRENDFFDTPIITPTTKANVGHDEDISKADILKNNLCTPQEWATLENYALALFERGKKMANNQGLILADAKYEFGKIDNEIILIDELHTPDSSRFFYKDGFAERLAQNEKQKQLSKEFVREWLIENNFMGKPGQVIPEMNTEKVTSISNRYTELYEQITGETFFPRSLNNDELIKVVEKALEKYDIT